MSVNEQQEPTREPPVFASQTIKAFVDLQLAERRNNILKSEERESLNSIQVSSTESPAKFDVITAVPDRTTGIVNEKLHFLYYTCGCETIASMF